MLENGKYPIHLKNRIRGGHGHLSNKEALDLFITHRSPNLSHLLLSHLSKENNSPEMVEALFKQYANGITIAIAYRHRATEIFSISQGTNNHAISKVSSSLQLGLFE